MEVIVTVHHSGLLAKIDKIDKALGVSIGELTRALVDVARQVVRDPELTLAKIRRHVPPRLLR